MSHRPDYESIRCDILYPEIERIVSHKDVNNLSHENLKNLLKNLHYTYLCEADEAMYDEYEDYDITDNENSYRRSRSYSPNYHIQPYMDHYIMGYPKRSSRKTPYRNMRSEHSDEDLFVDELNRMLGETKSPKVKEAIQEIMQEMMGH